MCSSDLNMKYNVVQTVKSFLNYLIEHGLISQNLYLESIRPINYKKEKIPSYYTKQEILKIESCVDRKNIVGKRDYAMILLASRLGLRSSDIRCLKFHEIDWDKNEIHLTQKKTKKVIVLPLLEDVGVALIDYIQNARPKTSLKDIFVSFRPPYRTISSATLSTMMAKYINKSGINCYGKHHGIHSMRHSLATNLLGDNVSLPTISSILGHSSTESAKDYMSIDLNSLIYFDMLPRVGKSRDFVLSAEFAALFQPVVEKAVAGFDDFEMLQSDVVRALGFVVAVQGLQFLV